jgi:hypothetical protein
VRRSHRPPDLRRPRGAGSGGGGGGGGGRLLPSRCCDQSRRAGARGSGGGSNIAALLRRGSHRWTARPAQRRSLPRRRRRLRWQQQLRVSDEGTHWVDFSELPGPRPGLRLQVHLPGPPGRGARADAESAPIAWTGGRASAAGGRRYAAGVPRNTLNRSMLTGSESVAIHTSTSRAEARPSRRFGPAGCEGRPGHRDPVRRPRPGPEAPARPGDPGPEAPDRPGGPGPARDPARRPRPGPETPARLAVVPLTRRAA